MINVEELKLRPEKNLFVVDSCSYECKNPLGCLLGKIFNQYDLNELKNTVLTEGKAGLGLTCHPTTDTQREWIYKNNSTLIEGSVVNPRFMHM